MYHTTFCEDKLNIFRDAFEAGVEFFIPSKLIHNGDEQVNEPFRLLCFETNISISKWINENGRLKVNPGLELNEV